MHVQPTHEPSTDRPIFAAEVRSVGQSISVGLSWITWRVVLRCLVLDSIGEPIELKPDLCLKLCDYCEPAVKSLLISAVSLSRLL